jgi:branched-chain amino acid transport system permease protein
VPDFILWLLLSLGAGAAYALLANGVVAIYKGSGVLNFAQGAVAMFATYCYLDLVQSGMSKYLAILIAVAGAAAGGAIVATVIFRPLREAPALAKVVATLGILVALQGIAQIIWGANATVVPSLFPENGVRISGSFIGVDRFWMAGTALVIASLLWMGFRFTRLGLATQATSQNEKGASLLGFSPTVISAANWALGCGLAAIAGALIAPITTLDTGSMPLLVLPALAAALVGRFSSFWITTAAAFGIGWAQVWVFHAWTLPGVQTAAPFVVVIVVMVVAGRALPSRGAISEGRPPWAPAGGNRWIPIGVCSAAAVLLILFLNSTYQSAFVTSLTTAVLCLSLVVLTGYVGQISLMQMTFAGIGGFITAKFATNYHVPFPLSIVLGAIIIAPIGAALGLPALRVRGLSLAVVTLGAAVAVDSVFFQNQGWTNGTDGVKVPVPKIGGFSLDPFAHPARYAIFVLISLVLTVLMVGNLRRSGAGRRMLAVRSNERAAAVAGVNVPAVKLQAFALSSAIAGLAGGLLAYSNPFFVLGNGQFAAMPSITLLTIAYIGGIAAISGAVMGGVIATGGVLYVLILTEIGDLGNWYILFSGVGLVWTVLAHPDGVAPFFGEKITGMIEKAIGKRPAGPAAPEGAPAATAVSEPAREPARVP